MRGLTIDLSRRHALIAGIGAAAFGATLFDGRCANAARPAPLPANALITLRTYADILVPGAGAAGVADFVSAMLASDDPMHFYKYLDVPLAPAAFYTVGLTALDRLAMRHKKRRFPYLGRDDMKAIAGMVLDPKVEGWDGPPAFLFYFTVRNDALDVTYGSPAAYDRLGIPYMAHLLPPSAW